MSSDVCKGNILMLTRVTQWQHW